MFKFKIYILQEKIDTNTYFDIYSNEDYDVIYKLLDVYRNKHIYNKYRLVEVLK